MNNTTTQKPVGQGVGNYARRGYQGARNTGARAYGSFQGMNLIGKILTVVLVIALIIAIAMWIRYLYNITAGKSRDSPYLITNPIKIYERELTRNIEPPVDGLSYSFSWWMYIQDWDYNFGKMKVIFQKGTDDDASPGLSLYPRTNSLKVSTATYNDRTTSVESCDITDLPLNKWIHCVYVLNNRTVDIYLDGRLERSCVLRGLPRLNRAPVSIGSPTDSYNGLLSKLQYFNRALHPFEISEIYADSPTFYKGFNIFKRIGL